MAKIPVISRLIVEDFPDQSKWIGKLLYPINTFIAAAAFALTGHLTFLDNFLGQQQTLDFTYNGSQSLPLSFAITISATPQALFVVQATENISTPVAIALAWRTTQNNSVEITDVSKISLGVSSKLTQGARYQLRIRVMP